MTILAKQFVGKRNSESADLPAAENGQATEASEIDTGSSDKLFLIQSRARRLSSVSTIFLFLSALCVLFMGIIGGVAIYRAYARSQMQRYHFHGFCGVPYDSNGDSIDDTLIRMNENFREMANIRNEMESSKLVEPYNQMVDRNKFFSEEFDLDLSDDESYAKIDVPDFRGGRSGRFLHDFKENQTAIIDNDAKRCFVMDLDRKMVLPPQSMADLIQKMYSGYYEIDTTAIRKNMRVITPELDEDGLALISSKVQESCNGMKVYQLENFTSGVFKRSAELTNDGKFAEFTGRMVEYNLVNIGQVNEHERK